MHLRSKAVGGAAFALVLMGAVGCGDDDGDVTSTATTVASSVTTSATTVPTSPATGKTLAVKGVDYKFEGIPSKIAAGTTISFTNASPKEVHEITVFKLNDGETRSTQQLLALPEDQLDQTGTFKAVAVALPGKPPVLPEGPLTLTEPGRYLFSCNIKVGADPAAFEKAISDPDSASPPPDIPGGPEHYKVGMLAEATVA